MTVLDRVGRWFARRVTTKKPCPVCESPTMPYPGPVPAMATCTRCGWVGDGPHA